MSASYLPVQYVYKEVIQEAINDHATGKVFYFDTNNQVASVEGRITLLEEKDAQGFFIEMDPPASVRIDRIITVFGKPGAAYDEYNAFANACMDCSGGDDS